MFISHEYMQELAKRQKQIETAQQAFGAAHPGKKFDGCYVITGNRPDDRYCLLDIVCGQATFTVLPPYRAIDLRTTSLEETVFSVADHHVPIITFLQQVEHPVRCIPDDARDNYILRLEKKGTQDPEATGLDNHNNPVVCALQRKLTTAYEHPVRRGKIPPFTINSSSFQPNIALATTLNYPQKVDLKIFNALLSEFAAAPYHLTREDVKPW